MRILLVNDHSEMVGGAERFLHTIKDALEKRGHIIEVFGSSKGENFSSLFSRGYSIKWYNRILKKIKSFNPDVVHVNNCMKILSPSVVRACLNHNVPVVLTLHDLHYLCSRLGGINGRKSERGLKHRCFFPGCLGYDEKYRDTPRSIWRNLKLMLHRGLIKDGRIIFVSNSEFLSKAMEKSLGVKVRVIHNGIDIPEKSAQYNKEILFVGQLNEEKGLKTIISALNKVKGYEKKVLGKGPLKEYLQSRYKSVKFLGFQKPEEHYKKASIVVVPSIWMDTFPYTVLEAMSYGLCVVASKIGGIPEQVKDMETGLLFEPGNEKDFEKKLNYLLKNPNEIKRMGKNAKKFVKDNLSWDNVVRRYEEAYLEATKKLVSSL